MHSLLVSHHQELDEAVTTLLKWCSPVGHAGFEHQMRSDVVAGGNVVGHPAHLVS